MPTRYVVITSQRTGSSWLMDSLNQQDGSEAFGELFLSQPTLRPGVLSKEYPRLIEWESVGLMPRRLSTFRYCDELYARRGAIGFKLMYSQLRRYPELLWYFKYRGIRILHLTRDDLDVAISKAVATATGVAHRRSSDPDAASMAISVDPDSVIETIRKQVMNRRLARKTFEFMRLRYREFAYEDLVSDLTPVFDYLEIERSVTTSNLRKTVSSRSSVIANLAELQEAIVAAKLGQR